MAGAPAFEYVCNTLEARSDLNRLAARGTVRLALKKAGLDARSVTSRQLGVVLEEILPAELAALGVQEAASLGEELRAGLKALGVDSTVETAETFFARVGRSD